MVIELSSISKNFGFTAALKDVSITIPDGSFFIVVGPNGAGKTTMLRIIAGELLPSGGTVSFDKSANFKEFVSVAEENRDYFNEFNALSYCELYKFLYGDFDKARFMELLKRLDIPSEKPVESFSKGMKTWLLNSLLIASNSKIMIFDEPLQHLDPSVRMDFHLLLREERSKGRTVIISTHEISEFDDAAESVAIINHGRVVYTGEVAGTLFSHRMVPGTMAVNAEITVGPVFNEKLVRTTENIGREPLLKEVAAAYINGSDLCKNS
ncbi:MAG TPA: ABC transporter ATP-binding protein [bacterium]|nr:ABC transporter ATP-binding protein [bacterium]HPS29491.1 ABC transporter ATP-binding protein [bacterium]